MGLRALWFFCVDFSLSNTMAFLPLITHDACMEVVFFFSVPYYFLTILGFDL